ncbi:MAG: vWA domain-containing protein [Candidatus Thorarchaeota archaeon]
MKLRARRGRNQQGLCFVPSDSVVPSIETCKISTETNSTYSDIRISAKVPDGIIIFDSRVFDLLGCDEGDEVTVIPLSVNPPLCTEIHLDVVSNRDLQTHTIATAISKRIDDFQEHFDGLVLQLGQELVLPELRVALVVRSMKPLDTSTQLARIRWSELIKIHLGAVEHQPSNLCIIAEVAAATQIADVQNQENNDGESISRHQAIISALEVVEQHLIYDKNLRFMGIAFSDEVHPFITFDSETGDEKEITTLDSASLIAAFRNWFDTALDEYSNRPSNPGAALKYALDRSSALNEGNSFPSTIILFSSGVHSAGQNPVKMTRTNIGDQATKLLCVSVGESSAADIMSAIAKEGNGIAIHLTSVDRMNLVVDALNEISRTSG